MLKCCFWRKNIYIHHCQAVSFGPEGEGYGNNKTVEGYGQVSRRVD
jgi:hypothetical protein